MQIGIRIHKIQIILYDIGEEEVKSMKKIIIGRQDTTSRIKTNTWILFPIITFGVLIFLFNHFELIEVASFIGICVVLLGIIKYIYSLNCFFYLFPVGSYYFFTVKISFHLYSGILSHFFSFFIA